MSFKTLKDMVNNQENLEKSNDFITTGSLANNVWPEKINLEKDNPVEALRSQFLWMSDI